jgi:aminoglycoside phosphotransferase (APT) family kinase protein
MERIEGPDLLTLIGRKPWRVLWVARRCGEAHARLHTVQAPASLPPVRRQLQRAIPESGLVSPELASVALNTLAGLPDGSTLLHGDFHPGNLMLDGDTPVVIDWTNVSRGHPDADLARTLVLLRSGDPPPGTSRFLRILAAVGRLLLLRAYVRAYRRMRQFDPEAVSRWEIVQATERLTLGIDAERESLLRLLERRRRDFAKLEA